MDRGPGAIRRDLRPRGHRGGIYPLMRAALCVFVRDLIVSGVLTDMMRGRPAVYATFSGYDEVAHHWPRARRTRSRPSASSMTTSRRSSEPRRYAPRPYEIVVLSDHGQTQGATFKQRNGYGLDELVDRSLTRSDVTGIAGGDEQSSMVGHALSEATGKKAKQPKNDVSDRDVVVLGSGNLGLVYLMEERRRLTLEEIEARHPKLLPALREHPHVGWLLVRSSEHGAVALGARGAHYLAGRPRRGRGSARAFLAECTAAPAAHRRLPARRGHHGRQLLRPRCSTRAAPSRSSSRFHGGIGGDQTRPFILHPAHLEVPAAPDPRRRERARHPRRLAAGAPGGPGRPRETRAEGHFTPSV